MNLIAVIAGSLAGGFSIHSLHTSSAEADVKVSGHIVGGALAEAVPVAPPEGEPVDLAAEDLALFVVAGSLSSGFSVAGPFVNHEEAQIYASAAGGVWEVFAFDLLAARTRAGQ